MVLKNRMYFHIDKVPSVILACVLLYNFILFHEGQGRDEVFVDDQPTKRRRGSRSNVATEQAASAARDREARYLADKYLLATWGEEGSALDQARQAAEASYRAHQPDEEGGDSDEDAAILPAV